MALTDPTNTLAYHNARVFCAARDMSSVPCANVASAIAKFMSADKHGDTGPEAEALWFYGLHHGISLIRETRAPLEPLLPWENDFLARYHAELGPRAVRAFYYLVWICTREARHAKNMSTKAGEITAKFGGDLGGFYSAINGGESGISAKFLKEPPKVSIGDYCRSLSFIFYNFSWGSNYGGQMWGVIADLLVKFVVGEVSAELMLDTLFTLEHNSCSIFNKGHFYGTYSATLKRILDVQRSGQIPQAVVSDKEIAKFAPTELKALMADLQARFPAKLGAFVDWLKVEHDGSVHKYPKEIAEQHKKHGMTPEQKAAMFKDEQDKLAAELAQAEAALLEKSEFAKKWFTVMPGVVVPKFQRAA